MSTRSPRCSRLFVFPSIFFAQHLRHTSVHLRLPHCSSHCCPARWGLQAYYHLMPWLTFACALKLTSGVPLCSLYALLHTSRHNYHLSLLGVPCAVSAMRLGRYDFGAWSGFHATHRATYGVSALRVSIPNALRRATTATPSWRSPQRGQSGCLGSPNMESPCWLMW